MKDPTSVKVSIPFADYVRGCNCQNDFQDKRYGSGKRVHTPLAKKMPTAQQQWRCTVCASVR